MAEERQEELMPIYSAKDVEIIVWNRVLNRGAGLIEQGISLTDEDYSKMWKEEVRKIVAQIQERDETKREKFRRWMGITE